MKFQLKNAGEFGWDGLKGRAYSTVDDFENMSAAYFEVTGSHGKISSPSDRIYYIIDGKGAFIIDGTNIDVEKTDVVIVPKNTPYDYKAQSSTLKMFLVHSPAFKPNGDIKLK